MTKKIFSALLVIAMMLSCVVFTATAADNIVYLEEGATGGDGSKKEPLGSLAEAVEALGGKDGTIVIIGKCNLEPLGKVPTWEGMITFTAADDSSAFTLNDSAGVVFNGDTTIKDIGFDLGKNTHLNPLQHKMVFDIGEGKSFKSFFHLSSLDNRITESAEFILESGEVSRLDAAGGYCTSYANGCMGDSNIIINGGKVGTIRIAADRYMDNHTGISIGCNLNIVINGGEVASIGTLQQTVPEIMGALNFVFNNGTQIPDKFEYPEETVSGGVFIVKSAEGGMITPAKEEIGVFEVKANKGKIAVINGEQVLNGKVTLEAGETVVEWVDGDQPEAESIKIELTIDSKEIIKNGVKSELDVPAQIVESRTLVPLRAIFEALGATVEWDGATSTVTSEKDGTKIKLTIGDNNLYVNGEAKALDVPAQIIESRTMVPARAIAEAYGCDVAWNGDTRTVTITK